MDTSLTPSTRSLPSLKSLWQLYLKVLRQDLRNILYLSVYAYFWAAGLWAMAAVFIFSFVISGNKSLSMVGIALGATCFVVGLVALMYYSVLAGLASLKLISDSLSDRSEGFVLKESLRAMEPLFWPALLMGLLYILAVLGGVILLVLPGLALIGYFSLASLVLVFEKRSSTGSLRRSFELVSGDWWRLFWFWMRIFLITAPVWGLLGWLGDNEYSPYPALAILANFISIILSFFYQIFSSVAMIAIYRHLKELKPEKSNA